MNKYIDADKLKKEIEKRIKSAESCPFIEAEFGAEMRRDGKIQTYNELLSLITSLQQDKDVLELCSQVWWEDRGWIMIPPNVTLKGIESLLERVRHKIKWNEENGIEEQEQPPLPSNLDEAAEEYLLKKYGHVTLMDEDDKAVIGDFKAGAAWMAGQGETFNGFMSVSGKRSLIAIEGSSQNFRFGEDVIVQIRKKEE